MKTKELKKRKGRKKQKKMSFIKESGYWEKRAVEEQRKRKGSTTCLHKLSMNYT